MSQMCNVSKYAQNLHKIWTFNWFVQVHTCFMAILWPFFLESYTPGQVSTLKYVLVCTWYVPRSVQGSTRIKENGVLKLDIQLVCTSTYVFYGRSMAILLRILYTWTSQYIKIYTSLYVVCTKKCTRQYKNQGKWCFEVCAQLYSVWNLQQYVPQQALTEFYYSDILQLQYIQVHTGTCSCISMYVPVPVCTSMCLYVLVYYFSISVQVRT